MQFDSLLLSIHQTGREERGIFFNLRKFWNCLSKAVRRSGRCGSRRRQSTRARRRLLLSQAREQHQTQGQRQRQQTEGEQPSRFLHGNTSSIDSFSKIGRRRVQKVPGAGTRLRGQSGADSPLGSSEFIEKRTVQTVGAPSASLRPCGRPRGMVLVSRIPSATAGRDGYSFSLLVQRERTKEKRHSGGEDCDFFPSRDPP